MGITFISHEHSIPISEIKVKRYTMCQVQREFRVQEHQCRQNEFKGGNVSFSLKLDLKGIRGNCTKVLQCISGMTHPKTRFLCQHVYCNFDYKKCSCFYHVRVIILSSPKKKVVSDAEDGCSSTTV